MKSIINLRRGFGLCLFFVLVVSAFMIATAEPAPAAPPSEPYYKGKTITITFGWKLGGTAANWTQLIARHMKKQIPGNPTVLVESKPGAGAGIALTVIYQRGKRDGTDIVFGTPGVLSRWSTKTQGHTTYDLKEMELIVIDPFAAIMYVSTRLGIKDVKGLVGLNKTLKDGQMSAEGSTGLTNRLSGELLGYNVKQIIGYKNFPEILLALRRGEVDMAGYNTTGYFNTLLPLVKSGEIVVLLQSGVFDGKGKIIRDPRIPDVPTTLELYREIHGKDPEGMAWEGIKATIAATTLGMQLWLPPGVPKEKIQVLTTALEKVVSSPEYKNEYIKLLGVEPATLIGEAAHPAFRSYVSTPDKVKQQFKRKKK